MDDSSPTRHGFRPLPLWLAIGALAFGAGCSTFKGTTATSFLQNVRTDPDPNVRYASYEKLASPNCYDSAEQKAEAVKTLIAKLDEGREPIATRAVIYRTLGALHAKEAREAVIKGIADSEGLVRVHACRALGKVGTPDDATLLTRIMTVDILEDCKIAAIESVGELRPKDPRIMEVLVKGMDNEDPAFRLASLKSLRKISGKDLGVEPEPWRKYVIAQYKAAASAATQTASASDRSTPPVPGTAPFDPALQPTSNTLVPAPR
jgi:hypothetical protein